MKSKRKVSGIGILVFAVSAIFFNYFNILELPIYLLVFLSFYLISEVMILPEPLSH